MGSARRTESMSYLLPRRRADVHRAEPGGLSHVERDLAFGCLQGQAPGIQRDDFAALERSVSEPQLDEWCLLLWPVPGEPYCGAKQHCADEEQDHPSKE